MMTRLRTWAVTGAAFGLAGCGGFDVAETAARNQPLDLPAFAATSSAASGVDVRVVDFAMQVPEGLRVSESNGFYPMFTDIVWRGDPPGDRRAQIAALFEEAASRVVGADEGSLDAVAVVTLDRFHGVTERTRYTVGGVYSIRFTLTFVDPATGLPLAEGRTIQADLSAPGGAAAVELDRQGQTEKVRVTDHLAWTLAQAFARPVDLAR